MRKLRKIVAAIASSAMLLGTMTAIGGVMGTAAPAALAASTSSAAPTVGSGVSFSDVSNATPHAYAIYALDAMGIAVGNGDGTYTPSAPITRAEFAKEVDIAMGYGAAASSSASNCAAFTDICNNADGATPWYVGYVAVAAAQGLVNGVGNGQFNPDGQVTYAQVLTVGVRMLGFGPAVQGGVWPANYLAEASQLLLTNGVTIADAGAAAPRQDVAALLFNTVATNIATVTYQNNGVTTVSQCTSNAQFTCTSLMNHALNDTWHSPSPGHTPSDNGIVYQVSTPLGALPTMSVANTTPAAADVTSNVASNVILYGADNLQNLVGTQVGYITNINGDVIFAGVNSTATQATYLSSAVAGGLVTGATVQVNGATETVNNFASATLDIPAANPPNAVAVTNAIIPNALNNGDTVTVNTDVKGNIVSVIDSSLFNYMGVITNVDASAGTVQFDGVQPSQVNSGNYAPTFYGPATVAANAVISLDGQTATLSQLKTNDVIYVNYQIGSDITAISAYDQSATGTVTANTIDLGSATNRLKSLTINGTTYNVDGGAIIEQNSAYQSQAANAGYNNDTATVYFDSTGSPNVAFVSINGSTYPVGYVQVGTNTLPAPAGTPATYECWDSQTISNVNANEVGLVTYAGGPAATYCNAGEPGIVIEGWTSSLNLLVNGTASSVPLDPNGWTLEVAGAVYAMPTNGFGISRGTVLETQLNSSGQITTLDVVPGVQLSNIAVSGGSATGTLNNHATMTAAIAGDAQVYTSSSESEPQTLGSTANVVNNANVTAFVGGIAGSTDAGEAVLIETTGSSSTPTFGVLAGDVTTNGSSSYSASLDVGGTTSTYTLSSVNPGISLGNMPQGAVLELSTSGSTGTVVQAAVYNGQPGGAYVGVGGDWSAAQTNGWEYTINTVSGVEGMAGVAGGTGGFGQGAVLGGSGSEVAINENTLANTIPMQLNGSSTVVYDNVNQIPENQGDLQPGYTAGYIYVDLGADVNNNVNGSNGANTANVSQMVEAVFVQTH